MKYDNIFKNDDIFSKYIQSQPLQGIAEKIRPKNCSEGKLELIDWVVYYK